MSPTPLDQDDGAAASAARDPTPPTYAAFSPTNISGASLTSRQRSTIIVHRKSPLLVATPPAVTRALAYSHPFLLPLNRLAGLLSWTSGDPWESFLLVAGFWAIVLYGNYIILWAGPILVVIGLILGMYSRRFSPLSSTGLTGEKHHARSASSESTPEQHHKSLDEIVETLRVFTTRCNILLEPLLDLTDFLSTQRTATSATTKPALTALLGRIVLVTPFWILLTLPPFHIITIRRVIFIVGTIILTWHSKPCRISRVILWRSLTVRRICSAITGLRFSSTPYFDSDSSSKSSSQPSFFSLRPFRRKVSTPHAPDIAKRRRADSSGVRFTFVLYENQRRWLGIGWTYSLFAYERAAWTDEHLNAAPSKDEFELPEVPGGNAKWRWVPGSEWRVDGVSPESPKKTGRSNQDDNGKAVDDGGWVYYDNKWNDGRRGQDGWGRYTRRRKWCRDAELIEVSPPREPTQAPAVPDNMSTTSLPEYQSKDSASINDGKASISSATSKTKKKRWFGGSSDLTKAFAANPPTTTSSSPAPTTTTSASASTTAPANSESNTTIPETTSTPQLSYFSSSSLPNPTLRSTSYNDSLQPRSLDSNSSVSMSSGIRSSAVPGARRRHGSSRSRGSSKAATVGGDGTDRESAREREIEEDREMVDKWGGRPGGVTERAERGWGLSDDAHMGLS